MKFRAEHVFTGIDVDAYEKLHFDEAFNEALCAAVKLSRKVMAHDDDGKKLERVLRVGPDREIPKALQKAVKLERLEYEERLEYTWGSNHAQWQIGLPTLPERIANKIQVSGTLDFVPVPGGVKRISEGEVTVKILGIGGAVEKYICGDTEKSFDDAARFTEKWIREKVNAG